MGVIIAGSALAGALVLQALALAAGGRGLRAGTSGPTIVGLLIAAALAAGVGRRWAHLRWPATVGMAAAASMAALPLASFMVFADWLAGFYNPSWTIF